MNQKVPIKSLKQGSTHVDPYKFAKPPWQIYDFVIINTLFQRGLDKTPFLLYNNMAIGVWLSLARAPALGAGRRRFESCHPDQLNVTK